MNNLDKGESNISETISEKKGYPTILGASILFFIVFILMMVSGFFINDIVSDNNYYFSMTIIQVIILGVPPLIYLVAKGINIKKTLRLNKLSLSELLLVVGLSISGYFSVTQVTLLWHWILRAFGTPRLPELPAIDTGAHYLLGLISIALVPAILEEFLFRGIILRGYESMGTKKAIILTGVFFGLLHPNLANMPAYIILGILMCYIVYRTDSLWAGVIYHLINNAIAITIQYVFSALRESGLLDDTANAQMEISATDHIISYIVYGFMVLFFMIIFIGCLIGFNMVTKKKKKVVLKKNDESFALRFVQLLPAILACLILVANLVIEFWMLLV